MKILAFDTSTTHCSTALLIDGITHTKGIDAGRNHSELLLPMVNDILAETELTLTQLDCIAFGAGPGSFTGLRIACGVAQGLAFAADLPVIGISTLETVAKKVNEQKMIIALDARMGEIYHAAYTKLDDGFKTVSPPTLCKPQYAPQLEGDQWFGSGSGFDVFHEELSSRYHRKILDIKSDIQPHAVEITQLAASQLVKGTCTDPAKASPIYIRNKVALKESER